MRRYAPVLRPLRKAALVVAVKPPSSEQLLARLRDICARERIDVDGFVLRHLCDMAENDIRSCLHTLQFLSRLRNGAPLTLSTLADVGISGKDVRSDLLRVLRTLFSRQPHSTHADPWHAEDGEATAAAAAYTPTRLSAMDVLQGSGDYELIAAGCFENYLRMRFRDTEFTHIASAASWLQHVDVVERHMREHQSYALTKMLPYALMYFNLYCAQLVRPDVRYPLAELESRQRHERIGAIFHALLEAGPMTRVFFSQARPHRCRARPYLRLTGLADPLALCVHTVLVQQALALDWASAFLDIISPQLRPVRKQLQNASECDMVRQWLRAPAPLIASARCCRRFRALTRRSFHVRNGCCADATQIARTAGCMLASHVRWKLQDNPYEPEHTYVLEPDIEQAVLFGLDAVPEPTRWLGRQNFAQHAKQHRESVRRSFEQRHFLLLRPSRQLIEEEMLQQTMQRHADTVASAAPAAQSGPVPTAAATPAPKPMVPETHAPVADTKPIRRSVMDFFTRDATATHTNAKPAKMDANGAPMPLSDGANDAGHAAQFGVLFKFKEGVTNAVRRTVRMRDLL